MARRLVNALDTEGLTDREAMLNALDLIARAKLPDDATPEELRDRLDKCSKIAAGAIEYVS